MMAANNRSLGANFFKLTSSMASWIKTSTPLLKLTRLSLGRVSPEITRDRPPYSMRYPNAGVGPAA